ncbi:MAG TPA: adenosine deaminase, partial [Thermoanaerobaculia bacterium]
MSLDRFLLRLPKIELHVHLEGAMRPAVLLELARRNGIALPAQDEAGLKRWLR